MVCTLIINCHFFHFTQKSTQNHQKSINTNYPQHHRSSDDNARKAKDFYPFPDVSFFRAGVEGIDSSEESNREPLSKLSV